MPNAINVPSRTIFTGDNLDILRGINSECVDLIYLDPPFNSDQVYASRLDSEARGAEFDDVWTLDDMKQEWIDEIELRRPALFHLINGAKLAHSESMAGYLTFMSIRLLELHRVLKSTGSVYLHCDPQLPTTSKASWMPRSVNDHIKRKSPGNARRRTTIPEPSAMSATISCSTVLKRG